MSDLLSDKKIKQLCVKYLAWDEPVSNRDLELIKPLFKAQDAKTKKGLVERFEAELQKIPVGAKDINEEYNLFIDGIDRIRQALKKEVEDG